MGAPGLVTAQYLVDKFTPLRFEYELNKALVESLKDVQIGNRRFEVRRFNVGKKPPQLLAARVYDLGKDTLGFDVDVTWDSELVVNLEAVPEGKAAYDTSTFGLTGGGSGSVPVSVRNFRFNGPVRVVVRPARPGLNGPPAWVTTSSAL